MGLDLAGAALGKLLAEVEHGSSMTRSPWLRRPPAAPVVNAAFAPAMSAGPTRSC